jgi:hypothetical protein
MVDPPPAIIQALGTFDLDPCSPGERRPWDTAKRHIGLPEDGLSAPWEGRVWLNPPYGNQTFLWVERLANHKQGIALISARTETKGFHREIWNKADAIFFFAGRIRFCHVDGRQAGSGNAPSCLVSYSPQDTDAIRTSGLRGKLLLIR